MTLAMASACVNSVGLPADQPHLDCPPRSFPAYGWLAPPRISFSRDYVTDTDSKFASNKTSDPVPDFEFRLDDPVAMLPGADELFSDGKLVPLDAASAVVNSSSVTQVSTILETGEEQQDDNESVQSEETKPAPCTTSRLNDSVVNLTTDSDPYVFSPKAPRCSSRWREFLGLKKLAKDTKTPSSNLSNTPTVSSTTTTTSKSIRYFLQRNSKSNPSTTTTTTSDSTLNLPLLRDSDSESISITSSRLSLSSISSNSSCSSSVGYDYVDDLPRLSLDSLTATKHRSSYNSHRHSTCSTTSLHRSTTAPNNNNHYPRVRMVKPRMVQTSTMDNQKPLIDHPSAPTTNRLGRSPVRLSDDAVMTRGVSVDSPRMISSGKIVFQGLERSSSSPSTFNGGPRYKHCRPIDRSYSANVRVIAPVLNVPVGSFRGSSKSGGGGGVFGFFSSSSTSAPSQQKKEGGAGSGGSNGVKGQQYHGYHQLGRR